MHENTKAGLKVSGMTLALVFGLLVYVAVNHARDAQRTMQEACIRNLQMIEGAKKSWALENKKGPTDQAPEEAIATFMRSGMFPVCPAGGRYAIGKVSENARCSMPGHTL